MQRIFYEQKVTEKMSQMYITTNKTIEAKQQNLTPAQIPLQKAMRYVADMVSQLPQHKHSNTRCCILFKDTGHTYFLYAKKGPRATEYLLCQLNQEQKTEKVFFYDNSLGRFDESFIERHRAYCGKTVPAILETMKASGNEIIHFEFPQIQAIEELTEFEKGFLNCAIKWAKELDPHVCMKNNVPLLIQLARYGEEGFNHIFRLIPKMVNVDGSRGTQYLRDKLLMKQDAEGRTVLHYAAYFQVNKLEEIFKKCPMAALIRDKEGFRPFDFIPMIKRTTYSFLDPTVQSIDDLTLFALTAIEEGQLKQLELVLPFISIKEVNCSIQQRNLLFQAIHFYSLNSTKKEGILERKNIITKLLEKKADPALCLYDGGSGAETTTLTDRFRCLDLGLLNELPLIMELFKNVSSLNVYVSPVGHLVDPSRASHILSHPSVLKYIDLSLIIPQNNILFDPDYVPPHTKPKTLRQYAEDFLEDLTNDFKQYHKNLLRDDRVDLQILQSDEKQIEMIKKNISFFEKLTQEKLKLQTVSRAESFVSSPKLPYMTRAYFPPTTVWKETQSLKEFEKQEAYNNLKPGSRS